MHLAIRFILWLETEPGFFCLNLVLGVAMFAFLGAAYEGRGM